MHEAMEIAATTNGAEKPKKNRLIGFPNVPASSLLPDLAHHYREGTRGGASSSSSAPNRSPTIPDHLFVQVVRHAVTSAQADPAYFQRQLDDRELEGLARNLLEVSDPESRGNFNNVFFREVVNVVTSIMKDICNKYEEETQAAIEEANQEFTKGESSEYDDSGSDGEAGRANDDHGDAEMYAQAEHFAILSKRQNLDDGLTWKEYKSMKFTIQFINETTRLENIVPGVLRKVLKDIKFKGNSTKHSIEGAGKWLNLRSYVKYLDSSITNARLYPIFSKYGTILSCKVAEENGKSKGFRFVQFDSEDSDLSAIVALHQSFLEGKQLIVLEYQKDLDEADHSGTLTEILVDDRKLVSVDMPLFVIEP
ncbi:hypothetical protein POM88_027949 [Heracleum sosnowskyi]|uniref:RRM domain-containing protein n=1 Tax=Heracleum sosnowskyi TaxID=360622 RepID=A0AAD8IC15_9APIA|nr:hypothetical protein POM88_027949 [Heracleum sosnowskyi]